MTAATTLDELLAHEAIKALKYAYVRMLDQKLWDQMGELFTPDATAAYSGGKYQNNHGIQPSLLFRDFVAEKTDN